MTSYSHFSEFLSENNVFDEIKTIENFPFLDESMILNMQLNIKFGERYLINKFNSIELNDIAKLLVNTYSKKWNDLIQLNVELNLKDSGKKVEKITDESNKTLTGNNETVNKVGAYNSDVLIDDNSNVINNNETEEKDGTTTKENTYLDYATAFNNLSFSDKTNTINVVLKDVANYMTLDIY